MKWFEYTAIGANGEPVEGRLRAESVDALRWELAGRGLQAGAVSEVEDSGQKRGLAAFSLGSKPSARSIHLELSLAQISVMLRSGFTLLAAVEAIIEQPPSKAVQRVFRALRNRIEEGSSLAEAMGSLSCFPPSAVAMVGMGEESGNLDTVIKQAAATMETRRQSKSATLTALFYPTFTFLLAIGICAYLVIAVIPPMKKALESLGKELPAITQSLLDVAAFFTQWGLTTGIVVLTALITLALLWVWPPGRLALDRFALRLPIIGTILRTGATTLFARSLATLLGSGIPLVESLRIASSLHGNRYIAAVADSARRRVLEGGTLAEGLDRPHAYMPMMLRMAAVGEVSGNLEETLGHAAAFHEEQLQSLVKRLSAILEPLVVLGVGTLVGYVYIAFFIGLYAAV